jgi:co-chaperonin GroES (HSP10)
MGALTQIRGEYNLTNNLIISIIGKDKEAKMDTTKIEVKGDRVLVKQLKFTEKIGSFIVPDSVKERKLKRRADAWRAEVISLGDRVYFEPHHHTFKKGDVVYCSPVSLDCPAFEGDDGEKYIILTQEDLIAKEIN